jgi:hypothetical protein
VETRKEKRKKRKGLFEESLLGEEVVDGVESHDVP